MKQISNQISNEEFHQYLCPRIKELNLGPSSFNFLVANINKLQLSLGLLKSIFDRLEKMHDKHSVSTNFDRLFSFHLEVLLKPKEPTFVESSLNFFTIKPIKPIDVDQNISNKFSEEETFDTEEPKEDFNLYSFEQLKN